MLQSAQYVFIFFIKYHSFDYKQNHIDFLENLDNGIIHNPIDCLLLAHVQARGIYKDVLNIPISTNTSNAMTRCLRFARRDTYLLFKKMIQQRGLADIWATDNRYEATSTLGLVHFHNIQFIGH